MGRIEVEGGMVRDAEGNEVILTPSGPTYMYEMFWCGHAFGGHDGWLRRLRLKIHNWTCRTQSGRPA